MDNFKVYGEVLQSFLGSLFGSCQLLRVGQDACKAVDPFLHIVSVERHRIAEEEVGSVERLVEKISQAPRESDSMFWDRGMVVWIRRPCEHSLPGSSIPLSGGRLEAVTDLG